MVADISSLVGLLNGQREQQQQQQQPQMNGSNTEILMTRDLLGSLSKVSNKDLDLDPAGKLYPDRCNSAKSPPFLSSSSSICSTPTRNFMLEEEETCLDLKLESSSSSSSSSSTINNNSNYTSVCTLDKVRSALQRAEKGATTNTIMKKRSSVSPPLSFSNSSSSKSTAEAAASGMFAAGCPGCLLYVMIDKANPKCPRCNAIVTSPLVVKKPRIDLNASSV